jgi:hypothetical protein
MPDTQQTIACIHDELGGLGCRDISLSKQAGCRQALFTRGGESVYLDPKSACRVLFLLRPQVGDNAVWKALQELAEM